MRSQSGDEMIERRLRTGLDKDGSAFAHHEISGDATSHPLEFQIDRHYLHCAQIGRNRSFGQLKLAGIRAHA